MTTILHEIIDRSNFAETTKSKYKRVVDDWIRFVGPDPSRWTQPRAQAFYAYLTAPKPIGRAIHPASANVYMASLRYASKWFEIGGYGPDFARVQMINVDADKTRRALSRQEIEALLATCIGKDGKPTAIDRRDRTLIVVGLETGMRRMSLAGWQLDGIRRAKDYTFAIVPIKGRGGKVTYEVPLSDTAAKILSDWRRWLTTHDAKAGPVFCRLVPAVSKNQQRIYVPSGSLSTTMIYKLVAKRATLAGLKDVHPHLLRHTFMTWRTATGLNPPQIASITGTKLKGTDWATQAPYIDMAVMANTARNATPQWLAELVDRMVRS